VPIIDIEFVCEAGAGDVTAQALANALGEALGSRPGQTWVRLHNLDRSAYAENGVTVEASELPAFVTILHAHPPAGAALLAEVAAVTAAVAHCAARPPERVHVQYATPGAGRQAFGGRLVE
jgi:phenylpyruvate tautomerase PptA (4-oxalocrotonate tautomerase family)